MNPRIERLGRVLATAVAGMSAEQMAWHPPGKWSAAEILEHLYLTYSGTAKGCARVLAEGKSIAGKTTFQHRFRTFAVVGLGYFPPGRKSPERAEPKGLPFEKVSAEIGGKLAEMDELISQCEARFNGKLMDHPILGPLTAEQWRKFHVVHGMHHLKQIELLRRSQGVPAP